QQQLEAYKKMDQEDLFMVEEVFVDVPASDMPGPTRFKAACEKCGTIVRDKREVLKNSKILCRSCAFGAYYQPVKNRGKKNVH
ncbi:MAG: formylmethanofuran dehydrogenase, partial [Desulfobacula sp.]|nr:formylmethanofuran dehydrogenase [Desulfobacula sp.]